MRKSILTYGTFDLFHVGHLNLLSRLKALGDYLIVGVSTDEFNATKGKRTIIKFEDRLQIVRNVKPVDLVIPEHAWDQKQDDIRKYNISIFGMGSDWEGKFDELRALCEVVYLPRTKDISSTQIRRVLTALDRSHVEDLKKALDLITAIVERFD